MDRAWGIRVEPRTEVEGLDLAEHGTWGYPEFAGVAAADDVADARARVGLGEPAPQPA
jgi:hypothetical protein